jgi:hypothetical protein
MPNCGPKVELKRTHQVFDVGCACPPCKGSAPYPYATRPCLSTRDGEHQSGPQTAFTPPRRSLSPLPHSLSYLPRSLPWERERARHDLHCRWPELHVVAFSVTPAAPPLSLTTLASSPSCTAPPRMGSQPLPPSCPLWPPVPCSMAVVLAPLPLRILVPSSCHHHLRRAMPHAQRFFPGFLLSPERPAAGAVPLGVAGVHGQHVAGHHRASRGHRWVHTNPVVLPRLLAADDEPPSALNHELLRTPSVNPDQGLRATIQEKTGPICIAHDSDE